MLGSEEVMTMHIVRANAYLGLGENSKAIDDLNVVLQQQPQNSMAQHLLTVAEMQDGSERTGKEPE